MLQEIKKHKVLPTTVYRENILDKFSEEIKMMMDNHNMEKKGVHPHHFSADKYILNSSAYSKLKKYIELFLTAYIAENLQIDGRALVTQSWVNANKPGEHTHRHIHPNSFASGVLYLSVSGENAGIMFHKPTHYSSNVTYTLQPRSNNADVESEMFPVSTGDLIAFPSYLTHSVPKNTTDQTRWSLAFNSLTQDVVGSYDGLTEFKI